MKKLISFVLSALVLFAAAAVPVSAAGELTFGITNSGTAYAVTGSAGVSGDVIIPSTHNGLPVVSIAGNAFKLNTGITSVSIPSSVTFVGAYAFDGCTSLTDVAYADTATGAIISNGAFRACSALETVDLPDGLELIGEHAFANCRLLAGVTIPDTVESIGGSAFLNCYALTELAIPASVNDIEPGAFVGCTALAAFTVNAESTEYYDVGGVIFDSERTLVAYPEGNISNNYTVPGDTLTIGELAFSGNESLKKVTLPEGLKTIDDDAFINCKKLESIVFPSSVDTIGSLAFGYCDLLKVVIIPATVTEFDSAFYMCGVETVSFEQGLTEIGETAFQGCEKLSSVIIPPSVSVIGNGAFCDCPKLLTAFVPNKACTAGVDAFGGTSNTIIAPAEVDIVEDVLNTVDFAVEALQVRVYPGFASKTAIEWSSSDESVATVSSTGEVSVVAPGRCVITAAGSVDSDTCAVTVSAPRVSIKNPSTTVVNFGDTLVIHPIIENMPAGYSIKWAVNGSGVVPGEEGSDCLITATDNGEATVTLKIVDSNGNPYVDDQNNEITSTVNLTMKAGFVQRLVSFFKNLFRINRIIPTAFKIY